jgi:nicotinamidase-related amidase
MQTAVLVVDMQQEVLDNCVDAPDVIERINALSRRALDAGAPVIFIQHEGEDELVRGTRDWQLAETLEIRDGAHVVAKSYRDGFADTELQGLLGRLGVSRVVVTGAHSDFCVQTTALSALVHGFDVVLVSDGHTATPDDGTISAESLRDLVNARFATLRYPGRTVKVLPASDVAL